MVKVHHEKFKSKEDYYRKMIDALRAYKKPTNTKQPASPRNGHGNNSSHSDNTLKTTLFFLTIFAVIVILIFFLVGYIGEWRPCKNCDNSNYLYHGKSCPDLNCTIICTYCNCSTYNYTGSSCPKIDCPPVGSWTAIWPYGVETITFTDDGHACFNNAVDGKRTFSYTMLDSTTLNLIRINSDDHYSQDMTFEELANCSGLKLPSYSQEKIWHPTNSSCF